MNSSQMLRATMAAVMYLMMIWGYMALQTPQWFAVFAALVMSITLLFWVSEARHDAARNFQAEAEGYAPGVRSVDQDPANRGEDPTLSASVSRLDSLKSELNQQYAQFGRDQSLINRNGLGFWHKRGNPGRPYR